jgi:manganese/zinc/iron transport system ATP- binding protein
MPHTSDWVLRTQGLSIGYGHSSIFRDVSLEIPRGEIVGIVGPNGSGKTTLLRTMLGLLPPLAGRVERRTSNISYVSQRDHLDTVIPVTTLDVVLMGLAARRQALHRVDRTDREAARHALRTLGVESLADTLFRRLSTGQQQRVLMARALATAPDLLVLDEPTAGMDVASEAALLDFLQDLNRQQVTMLLVTHTLPTVLNLATSIILLAQDLILQGPVDDVLQEARLTDLYGVPIHLGRIEGRRTLVVGSRR